jgi:hypothetical protein
MRLLCGLLATGTVMLFASACGNERTVNTPPAAAKTTPKAAAASGGRPLLLGDKKVHVRLVGLCSIVDPSLTNEATKTKTVILAKQAGHAASLIVHEANLSSTNGFSRVLDAAGAPYKDYWEYKLNGMHLELDKSPDWADGSSLDFSDVGMSTNDIVPDQTNPKSLQSLQWIPRLSTILGKTPSYQAKYYKPEPDPNDVLVRMPLRGGALQSILASPYWLWAFRSPGGHVDQVQVVADEIDYSFAVTNGATEIAIYGRPFQGASATELFKLKRVLATSPIQITLANIPPNSFEDDGTLSFLHEDKHFNMHFNKLTSSSAHLNPVVIGQVKGGSPAGGGVYCGPDGEP